MARANQIQLSSQSSSDSGDEEDIPKTRPHYIAEAGNGRHEEAPDDDEADEVAGVINDASLFAPQTSLLSAAGNSIRHSLNSFTASFLGQSKTQPENLDGSQASPDRMSMGVNQPKLHKISTKIGGNRLITYTRNNRTSRGGVRQPKATTQDVSKKSGLRSSKTSETLDPPQSLPSKSIRKSTNKRAYPKSRQRVEPSEVDEERVTSGDDYESEDEQDEQDESHTESTEPTPAKNNRSKSTAIESHATHEYATRSMPADTAKRAGLYKRLGQSTVSTSKKSSEQPQDLSPKRGRGRPRKAPRKSKSPASIPPERRLASYTTGLSENFQAEEADNSTLTAKLESLSDVMDNLGCRMIKVNEKLVFDRDQTVEFDDRKYRTSCAKSISVTVEKLKGAYIGRWEAKSAEAMDTDSSDTMYETATYLLIKLKDGCDDMVKKLVSCPQDARNSLRTKLLEDIYVRVVPGLVDALKAAGKDVHEPSQFGTENLEEFSTLLEILRKVAATAGRQNAKEQPRVDRISYPLAKPTSLLLPILKELHGMCEDELISRKRTKRTEELRRTRPERRKKREREAEEARLAEKELQQRVEQRQRAIFAQVVEQRRRLGMPPYSQPAAEPASSASDGDFMDVEEEVHDEDQPDTVREVGLFGKNNLHAGTAGHEWSQSEIDILIKGLRRDRGPTRYGKLAMRLDRTLDEIFEQAKYLKAQVEFTLQRLQEENPDKEYPSVKPWIENIGSERYHAL